MLFKAAVVAGEVVSACFGHKLASSSMNDGHVMEGWGIDTLSW